MVKVNLLDCTFVIPIYIDSPERLSNLLFVVDYIKKHFRTHIIIVEYGKSPTKEIIELQEVQYVHFREKEEGIFPRTEVINCGLKLCGTDIVSICDADCFVEPRAYVQAVSMLRGGMSISYPYNGDFKEVSRRVIKDGYIEEHPSYAKDSVGGICFLNRKDYENAGFENENIISWGSEDAERIVRMTILGHSGGRVTDACCWHITHPRGINSGPSNPYTGKNTLEYQKVKNMNKSELLDYIKTWSWRNKNIDTADN